MEFSPMPGGLAHLRAEQPHHPKLPPTQGGLAQNRGMPVPTRLAVIRRVRSVFQRVWSASVHSLVCGVPPELKHPRHPVIRLLLDSLLPARSSQRPVLRQCHWAARLLPVSGAQTVPPVSLCPVCCRRLVF